MKNSRSTAVLKVTLMTVFLMVFCVIPEALAQTGNQEKAAQQASELLKGLETDIERYRELNSRVAGMSGNAATMLRFELDAHLLQMLRATDSLAALLPVLPDGDRRLHCGGECDAGKSLRLGLVRL